MRGMQVGITIVAFEYERQREKEVAKKKQEAAERMAIIDKAKQEQEVRWSQPRMSQHRLLGRQQWPSPAKKALVDSSPWSFHRSLLLLQRLAAENVQQTQLIQRLMTRVDSLEVSLQQRIEEALRSRGQPKGMFGGFFGPRAQVAKEAALWRLDMTWFHIGAWLPDRIQIVNQPTLNL
jgi:hypothetical protein